MNCVIEEFNLCISMIMWHIHAQLQGSVSQHKIGFLSLKENLYMTSQIFFFFAVRVVWNYHYKLCLWKEELVLFTFSS